MSEYMLVAYEVKYIKANIKTVRSLNIEGKRYKAWKTEEKLFFTTVRRSGPDRFLNPPTESFPRKKGKQGHSYEWEFHHS